MSLHPGLVPFPQSAAAPAGGAGAAALVRFKAGKLTTEWKSDRGRFLVTPQPEKGEIVLTRGEEGQLLHFQWRNRVSKEVVDDYIVFADCEYKRVDTGRPADRVFMLEWTGRARDKRFFFWMQDKDASKDEERMRSINLHISNPAQAQPSDGGLDWNAFSSVLQQNAQPNAAPDAPPNSETQRLRLEQLQSALSQMEIPAPAPAGSSAEEKAADGGEQGASGRDRRDVKEKNGRDVDMRGGGNRGVRKRRRHRQRQRQRRSKRTAKATRMAKMERRGKVEEAAAAERLGAKPLLAWPA
eukprot:scaffold347_cov239-Pinguiococcus_pyrenoidosus.AAC.18